MKKTLEITWIAFLSLNVFSIVRIIENEKHRKVVIFCYHFTVEETGLERREVMLLDQVNTAY